MSSTLPPLPAHLRTAWVSGASSGIGQALCRALLARGLSVWGTSRNRDRLASLAEHANFHAVELDLEHPAQAAQAYEQAEVAAGGFDLVVHNAGYGVFGRFEDVSWETWQPQLTAMVSSTVMLNQLSFRSLKRKGRGTLVNVSSLAVSYPLPFMAVYNVAKAGLSALSESLIAEARGTDLVVVDFRPGDVRTDFNQAIRRAGHTDERLQRLWSVLERNLADAPEAEVVVGSLWRALARNRSGTVVAGGFFQAKVATVFAKLAPQALRRRVARIYFGD